MMGASSKAVIGLALPLALLGACERADTAANAKICQPFAAAAAATASPGVGVSTVGAPTGELAGLDDCLHRHAYRLSRSGDPAEVVAEATVAACGEQLSRWNTQALAQAGAAGSTVATDLVTGEQSSVLVQHRQFTQGRALFYVVQGRAGRCALPA